MAIDKLLILDLCNLLMYKHIYAKKNGEIILSMKKTTESLYIDFVANRFHDGCLEIKDNKCICSCKDCPLTDCDKPDYVNMIQLITQEWLDQENTPLLLITVNDANVVLELWESGDLSYSDTPKNGDRHIKINNAILKTDTKYSGAIHRLNDALAWMRDNNKMNPTLRDLMPKIYKIASNHY